MQASLAYTRCGSDSHPPGCGCGQHRYSGKALQGGKEGEVVLIEEDTEDLPLEEYWSPPDDETLLWESLASFYIASSAVQ